MQRKPLRAGVALLALAAVASVAPGHHRAGAGGRAAAAEPQPLRRHRPHRHAERRGAARRAGLGELQPVRQHARGATSPSSSCRGCRRRCATRRSATGGTATIPDYNLFDRSLDVQFQLLKEKGWQPSVALGFRDVLGTGVYSAEYLVATKTVARDFTRHRRHRLGAARQRRRGREPVLLDRRQLLHPRDRLRQGRQADVRRDVPRREDGLLRRRRVADADRQADAEGRDLVGRLYPRAAEPGRRTSSASRRSTSAPSTGCATGITLGGYYMYGSTVGFNVVVSGNPYKPLTPQNLGTGPVPVNPRPADANRSTAWVNDPAAQDEADRCDRRGAERRRHHARRR